MIFKSKMNKLKQVNSYSYDSALKMKFKNKKVKDAYTEELLFELIQRIKMLDAPTKKELYGDWEEGVVGIGKDHTASILIPDEDKYALYDMIVKLNK